MRRALLVLLLLSLPVGIRAQQGSVLREASPADDPGAVGAPPADEGVTAAPLPPPDDDDVKPDKPRMVPNPLDKPDTAPGAKKQAQPQTQPQGQPQRGAWVQMGSATIQALDKVNARSSTLVVKVGDSGHFGSLVITVRGCYVRGADRPADATAYLVVRDERPEAPSFSGWMVRSAPFMSMMAHPIYDLRITGCSP